MIGDLFISVQPVDIGGNVSIGPGVKAIAASEVLKLIGAQSRSIRRMPAPSPGRPNGLPAGQEVVELFDNRIAIGIIGMRS